LHRLIISGRLAPGELIDQQRTAQMSTHARLVHSRRRCAQLSRRMRRNGL
jgi:hypothetical protein